MTLSALRFRGTTDEADFITGVSLPVDGGMLVDVAPGRRN
jgi:hypothetical protein